MISLLIILASQRAPTAATWEKALADSQVPVHFSLPFDPDKLSGYLRVTVNDRPSGFYFTRDNYAVLSRDFPALAGVKLEQPIAYSLRYGEHPLECAATFYSASVMVARFGGVVFDPQAATFMTEKDLTAAAKECQRTSDHE
jgi:hypothetical protein